MVPKFIYTLFFLKQAVVPNLILLTLDLILLTLDLPFEFVNLPHKADTAVNVRNISRTPTQTLAQTFQHQLNGMPMGLHYHTEPKLSNHLGLALFNDFLVLEANCTTRGALSALV